MRYLQSKKLFYVVIFLFIFSNKVFSQNFPPGKKSDYQGFWLNTSEDGDANTYWHIFGDSLKEVTVVSNGSILKSKKIIGFSDYQDLQKIHDDSLFSKLKNEGSYFYIISESKNGGYRLVGYRVAEIGDDFFTITGSRPVTFERLDKLPENIKEYFSFEKKNIFKFVSIPKSFIYSSINPLTKTKMYLIKGDKVEVLNEEKNWIRIKYSGKKKIVEGWIKKSDVK